MARPNWEYIRVDVLLPEHPKADELSPLAKWTLIELWCYCGRHRTDGHVSESRWNTFGTKAVRDQLLRVPAGYKHGFVEKVDGGYLVHDYLGHQRSREEIDELSAKRTAAAKKAAAARWGGDAKTHTKTHTKPRALPDALSHTKTHAERMPIASCVPMPKAEAEKYQYLRNDGCKQRSYYWTAKCRVLTVTVSSARDVKAGIDDMNCFGCGGEGHLERDCPNTAFTDRGESGWWCGICDQRTRLAETADGLKRCPECNPLRHQHLHQLRRCPSCKLLVHEWDTAPCGRHSSPEAGDHRPPVTRIREITGRTPAP